MASLSEIVIGIRKSNELLANDVLANRTTAAMITAFVKSQQIKEGDKLEASRERGKPTKTAMRTSKPSGNSGGLKGLKGFGGIVAALGVMAAGGIGIAAIGLGIAGFFGALAGGDMALKDMQATGKWLGGFVTNIADAISALVATGGAKVLGGLFVVGALFGAVPGSSVKRGAKAVIGITALGLGIASFFTVLGAGDMALGEMEATGARLGTFMTNISAGINVLVDTNAGVVLGGLFVAGGLFGLVAGPAMGTKVGKKMVAGSVVGIVAIGAAINAFFATFAAGDLAISSMKSTGEAFKALATNMAEGIMAFGGSNGVVLGAVMATGGFLGPMMIRAGVGIALMGVALGSFFAGIALGDKVIQVLNRLGGTEPGEGFKKLLVNTADGLQAFGDLKLNSENISGLAKNIVQLSSAMTLMFGIQGLGKVGALLGAPIDLALSVIDKIFGTKYLKESNESPIQKMVNGLAPLNDLDDAMIGKMDKFANALDRFFKAFKQVASTELGSNFSTNIATIMSDMGAAIRMLPVLVNGGNLLDEDSNWMSKAIGTRMTNFGSGLKGMKNSDLEILRQGVHAMQNAITGQNFDPIVLNPVSGALTPKTSDSTVLIDAQRIANQQMSTHIVIGGSAVHTTDNGRYNRFNNAVDTPGGSIAFGFGPQ